MCRININNELNGIELQYNSKPDTATLTAIKENGFRWHNKKKIWYAKITEERMTFVNSLSDVEVKADIPAVKDDQKILKEEIMTEYEKIWGGRSGMMDYCRKNCAYVVKLKDGYYEINRPSIETSFCFGYGLYGVSSQEDYDRAEGARHHAATKEDYFLEENLKGLNEWIEYLQTDKIYAFYKYNNKEDKLPRIYNLVTLKPWEVECNKDKTGFYELSQEEIEAVLNGYKEVKRQFEKRLHTYLKRYGLSKLRTWTYLVD